MTIGKIASPHEYGRFLLNAGTGEHAGEALLQGEEVRLKPTVADGRQCHRDGESYSVAEEVAPQTRLLIVDRVVANHET